MDTLRVKKCPECGGIGLTVETIGHTSNCTYGNVEWSEQEGNQ